MSTLIILISVLLFFPAYRFPLTVLAFCVFLFHTGFQFLKNRPDFDISSC